MKPVVVSRTIRAPRNLVFETVADIRNFQRVVPAITNVEFLTERQRGTGTRFRETRRAHGSEHAVELEIAEYVENECVRLTADAGGTIWDTVFRVSETATPEHVELRMAMEARPYRLMARIMNRFVRRMIVKGVEADMDAVKAYCEAGGMLIAAPGS